MQTPDYIEQDRLLIEETSVERFIRQRVIFGDCRQLEDKAHAELREAVAANFGIHPNHVIVVGSAKLGYSISPAKPLKPFDSNSDLDLAVVDGRLFDKFWEQMHALRQTAISWPEFGDFRKYHFNGWMRPDKLPIATIRNDWFDFFTRLQKAGIGGGLPIRAGLYKSWYFLEAYQAVGATACLAQGGVDADDGDK